VTSTSSGVDTGVASASSSGRRALVWILVGLGLLLVGVLAGAPDGDEGVPFDPESSRPSGTKALVLLLESFGAEVDVSAELPDDETDIAVVFSDLLETDDAPPLDGWIDRGGTLVVADPFSGYAPDVEGATGTFGVAPELEPDRCDVAALGDLHEIDPGVALVFEVGPDARSCYGEGDTAFVVEQDRGRGVVVSVGGGDLFTNERLGDADNAAFAARLLVPSPGTRVAILQPGDGEGTGDRSLDDVLSTGARLAIFQFLVAFLVYAWYRARRLGKPVLEPQPVEIAGSELVIAVGQLLQQTKDPNRAAALLRADVRRRIAERLGLPASTPADALVDVVATRSSADPDRVRSILTDTPIATDTELLELARATEALRKEVLDGS
jgi:hypothetical protein